MNAIAVRPPTSEDYRRLQIECKQIAEPFVKMICDVYSRSQFKMIYSPSQPGIAPSIIYAEEWEVENIRAHMKAAVNFHIADFNKRFGLSPNEGQKG